jgi:hypothetical protein
MTGPAYGLAAVMTAPVNLNHPGYFIHWGVIQLSLANLLLIAAMVVLFAAAVFLPFPKGRGRR